MNLVRSLVLVGLSAVSAASFAAAPELHVSKHVTIDAPAATVWDKVKNFDGINTWHPAFAKDQIISGNNNEVGAERLLTIGDGGTVKEKLLHFDEKHRTFKYTILEGVLPVSDYHSTLSVKAEGKDKSVVTWSSTFKRKNTGANPGENENDATAEKTVSGAYQAGLDNLKKVVEGK